MQIEIYADVVFMINLIMDYLILWIVSKLKGAKTKKIRIFLGSLTASSTYCLLIFMFNKYYNFLTSIIILALSLIVTFGIRGVKDLLKSIFYAHISAFAVGGLSIALFYYTNITDVIGNALGFTIEYFSIKILIISICISFILIKAGIYIVNRFFIKKQVLYNVKVLLEDENIFFTALMDTGNTLLDPITKYPVIIAEFESIKDFLPEKIRLLFYEKKETDYEQIIECFEGTKMASNIRLIPFKSLGKEKGMIIGFKPDKVEITNENETFSLHNVVIGIYNLNLSNKGEYHGLLNPEILGNNVESV